MQSNAFQIVLSARRIPQGRHLGRSTRRSIVVVTRRIGHVTRRWSNKSSSPVKWLPAVNGDREMSLMMTTTTRRPMRHVINLRCHGHASLVRMMPLVLSRLRRRMLIQISPHDIDNVCALINCLKGRIIQVDISAYCCNDSY